MEEGASVPTNPLFAASKWDFEEVIEERYFDMADLDDLNGWGRSAVDLTFQYNNCGILRKIIDKGARMVRLKDMKGHGESPLMCYEKWTDMTTVRYLLSQMTPQDLSLQDPGKDRTALHFAVDQENENLEFVKALVQAMDSTTVPLRDHAGRTPLHSAADRGHKNIVLLLLQNMIPEDIVLLDSWGRSALFYAVGNGNKDLVKLILDRMTSADVPRQDKYGETVLHVACASRLSRANIVPLLLGKMSVEAVMLKNDAGESALDIVKDVKDFNSMRILEEFITEGEDRISHGLGTESIMAED